MTIRLSLLSTLFFIQSLLQAQALKPALTQEDISHWNQIESPQLSNSGRWVGYQLKPNEGDPTVILYDTRLKKEYAYPRGSQLGLGAGNLFAAFLLQPHEDSLKAQRRRKVKKEALPKDTLGILRLSDGQLLKIPGVQSYVMPGKWDGWIAYQLAPMKPDSTLPDSVKIKKENEDNGSRLVIRNLQTAREDTIPYVKHFIAAEEGRRFLLHSTGSKDSTFLAGVYLYDCDSASILPLLTGKGDYQGFKLDKMGRQAAFLAYRDTLKAQAKPFGLYYWADTLSAARLIVDSTAAFLPDGWLVSEHAPLSFSDNGQRLFFGMAPPPILQDTSLLEEEIVNVEVWAYTDSRLYTQEEERLEAEKKRAYTCVYHIGQQRAVPLGSPEVPAILPGHEGDADIALGYDETPYLPLISWEGYPICKDVYLVDLDTGKKSLIAQKVCGSPEISPDARYVYWYSAPDSAWFAWTIASQQLQQLAPGMETPFYDELNDEPRYPSPYGIAGWTTEDDFLMIYDRYDVWLIDPTGHLAPNNLTKGRPAGIRYRYIKLDPEEKAIEEVKPMLFQTFNERTKSSGYSWFDIHTGIKKQIQEGPYSYSTRVIKARNNDAYLFTRESFREFPDLLYSQDHLSSFVRISQANPQQSKFRWGAAELYHWTGAQGQPMEGLLIKPDGFDPNQQYPMITYFYERNSDNLHRHWTPRYPRSIINFPYYASRGYLIFIPDIHYRIGYPGESALDAVTTGVTSLIDKGFVNRERIGVQGHSWGGYQSAYLITQTNLFRCAESGAPVVNMTSAYGGIRWESGLSRMFQYERSQSRIGGALWEKPLRYIENSPLFFADKIETPVLILHNDEDGAVPWYQGIEFFTALRRLGKPAWLLNYNGDPHGVKKSQNQKDFQHRMQQFFDHYLLDEPMPEWMKRGVPPLEKGIRQGF
ncbi:MAG: S9 family peptidase [Phaeodactylibacter sp.]|nr:S9 family peptidase [Phaeodactylibacter sp.]MCB9299123.1 S9 family peptidase [Lewinellaceae bacterium]